MLPEDRDVGCLVDMLENARIALGYVAGLTTGQFAAQQMVQDAVVRRIAIIGEAARLVSDARRAALP
mgnify:CR=1 FL=1